MLAAASDVRPLLPAFAILSIAQGGLRQSAERTIAPGPRRSVRSGRRAAQRLVHGSSASRCGTLPVRGQRPERRADDVLPYLDTLRWGFIAGGIAVMIYARLDDWKRGRR